ncbi:MAG TPA: sugar ABC transporter permease [Steroidobacteraceae bacterium]|nr:sugar ABC transporter permease [Steroidobacteraceae bacterium]
MTTRRRSRPGQYGAHVALLPMALTALVGYLGAMLWTLRVSLTSSRTFAIHDHVDIAQYARLFHNERWLLSLENLAVYGVLFVAGCLLIGLVLAVLIDRQVRAEAALRTAFLYPYAMSFVATGVVWQWLLNPSLGIQEAVRRLGLAGFQFDWIVDPDKVIYTIAIATIWQASGLVMVILLAGLRGVDPEIWKAARLDGIPAWRVYWSIVLPMLGHSFATAAILLLAAVVKLYDAVVAMTQGGPGTASEVPAKFIMDHLFGRANIALASAGAIVMLVTVMALLAPVVYLRGRSGASAR